MVSLRVVSALGDTPGDRRNEISPESPSALASGVCGGLPAAVGASPDGNTPVAAGLIVAVVDMSCGEAGGVAGACIARALAGASRSPPPWAAAARPSPGLDVGAVRVWASTARPWRDSTSRGPACDCGSSRCTAAASMADSSCCSAAVSASSLSDDVGSFSTNKAALLCDSCCTENSTSGSSSDPRTRAAPSGRSCFPSMTWRPKRHVALKLLFSSKSQRCRLEGTYGPSARLADCRRVAIVLTRYYTPGAVPVV